MNSHGASMGLPRRPWVYNLSASDPTSLQWGCCISEVFRRKTGIYRNFKKHEICCFLVLWIFGTLQFSFAKPKKYNIIIVNSWGHWLPVCKLEVTLGAPWKPHGSPMGTQGKPTLPYGNPMGTHGGPCIIIIIFIIIVIITDKCMFLSSLKNVRFFLHW